MKEGKKKITQEGCQEHWGKKIKDNLCKEAFILFL